MTDGEKKSVLAQASAAICASRPETERVLLRPICGDDFEDYFEYAVQPEQQRLCGNAEVKTRGEAREVFDFMTDPSHPALYFAIVLKAENRMIGNLSIGIYPFIETDEALAGKRGVSLSYVLNEKYWRRGIMTELLKALIPFLLRDAGLDFVNSGYFTFNEGSARLHAKLGMRHYTDHVYPRGNIPTREMIIYREDIQ